MEKKYWSSVESLSNTENIIDQPQAPDGKSIIEIIDEEVAQKPTSRRNFLKFCGFSFATAAIAASCENPVKKAIPYLIKPEEVTPGVANHYASTFFDGFEYNSIVVKVRDGRPIKIEGNPFSSISKGRTTARVQGSILSLYDESARLKGPIKDGKETTIVAADSEIIRKLNELSQSQKQVVVLTPNIVSPSTLALIDDFLNTYPGRHVMYEPVSATGMLLANERSLGRRVIPDYKFDEAEVIVSFMADFLGTWISPCEYAMRYGIAKDLQNDKNTFAKHYHFESGMTITGGKADKRFPIKPSEESALIHSLYLQLSGQTNTVEITGTLSDAISEVAADLLNSRGKSIVVSSSNDVNTQIIVNAINNLLGNYGSTIDLNRALLTQKAIDSQMEELITGMNDNTIGGIILWDVNPVYDYHNPQAFIDGLKKLELTVSCSGAVNETNEHVKFVLPSNHYLESWDDAEPKVGLFSLAQPVIRNLFNTRQAQDSLLRWLNSEETYYQYIKNYWLTNIITGGDAQWNDVLQKGVFESEPTQSVVAWSDANLSDALAAIGTTQRSNNMEVILYPSVALGKGNHSNNPWLMELPDPVTKVCWDNYASISHATAERLKTKTYGIISVGNIELPVFVQPGQADDTLTIALGYGHSNFGKVASNLGKNVFPFVTMVDNTRRFNTDGIEIKTLAGDYPLAIAQLHGSMEGRPIVRETILSKYQQQPDSGNELHKEFEEKHVTLYNETIFPGHHWGLGVDLNKCIGCSTCTIACQAENNIPVVGKEEVMKTRIMHWMRVDRYYAGSILNPEMVFQPLPCQHCDNAPCENVCPVSATNHSNEGLNQMAYSRCIGTKYCINNCPYKVRRFNWFRYATNDKFDFNMNTDLGRMVLNPDVVVRERGVVEKCTFCVQRIQEKKLQAKLENRPLEDGEILPACVQACPADALVFGDRNNPESKIFKLFKDPRNYHLLEELHTLPSVGYLTLVRNKQEE